MKYYTLIVYRKNHDDYCRNCHMGSTDSYHSICHGVYTDGIVMDLAHYLYKQSKRANDPLYADYQFTLLINGNPDYTDEKDIYLTPTGVLEDLIKKAEIQVREKLTIEKKEEEERQKKAKEIADAVALQRQDEEDRMTYERLKEKYK